jgi:hypothetical protein
MSTPPAHLDISKLIDIESWVEVSSHPSSSSVSSAGDEIVTTGLRVATPAYAARRRRLHPQSYARLQAQQQQHQNVTYVAGHAGPASTSSQEEYDESETDSDHVLTSSTENIPSVHVPPTPLRNVYQAVDDSEGDDDDDENATALGSRRPSEPFRPQPNAFSHPPSHLQHRHSMSSGVPQHHPTRPSYSQRSSTGRAERRAPNFMSPSYQADNDAALRASLTTLLSCAAAARGRNKDRDSEKDLSDRTTSGSSNAQPINLRFVPESELLETSPRPTAQGRVLRTDPPASPSAASGESRAATMANGGDKPKRSATPTPLANKSPKIAKKKKPATMSADLDETLISPTLMTWIVSAGVVVLVSVVGFGAGYVIGREVGRQDSLESLSVAVNASSLAAESGGNCGQELIRSGAGTIRKFRWGGGLGMSIASS